MPYRTLNQTLYFTPQGWPLSPPHAIGPDTPGRLRDHADRIAHGVIHAPDWPPVLIAYDRARGHFRRCTVDPATGQRGRLTTHHTYKDALQND